MMIAALLAEVNAELLLLMRTMRVTTIVVRVRTVKGVKGVRSLITRPRARLKYHCQLTPRRDGLKSIYDDYKVDPMLRILINFALVHEPITYYGMQDIYPINDWKPYKTLIKAQEKVGWKQLNYGRYVLEWDRCQRRYILATTGEEVTGEPQWIRAVIQETWKYQKSRWLARSETLHGKGTLTSQATKDALIARITALYEHEEKLLVQDRHPFNIPIDEWNTRSASYMKEWLMVSAPFIRRCLKAAKIHTKKNASDIRGFLTNQPKIPSDHRRMKKPKRKPPKSKDIRTFIPKPLKPEAECQADEAPELETTQAPSKRTPHREHSQDAKRYHQSTLFHFVRKPPHQESQTKRSY
jgi:hypothetical protein